MTWDEFSGYWVSGSRALVQNLYYRIRDLPAKNGRFRFHVAYQFGYEEAWEYDAVLEKDPTIYQTLPAAKAACTCHHLRFSQLTGKWKAEVKRAKRKR